MLLFLSLVLGCTAAEPPPAVEVAVPSIEVAAPATPDIRFVRASSLNLRAEPDGDKTGKLSINSPLEVLKVAEDQAHVRVANGKEGWVPLAFLAESPITVAQALAEIAPASTPEKQLSWAQRAAAIDARDRDAMAALAAAYRATNQHRIARGIDRQLEWPDDLLLVGSHRPTEEGFITVEWGDIDGDSWGGRDFGTPLSDPQRAERGLHRDREVWVLPTRSGAVRGTIQTAQHILVNECGGTYATTVQIEADLPEGESALAWSLKTPPASWLQPVDEVDDNAEAELRAFLGEAADELALHAVIDDAGTFIRTARDTSDPQQDMAHWVMRDYRIAPDGTITEAGGDEYNSYSGYSYPDAARDIDGDGHIDQFWGGGCGQHIIDHEGELRSRTSTTCCGC